MRVCFDTCVFLLICVCLCWCVYACVDTCVYMCWCMCVCLCWYMRVHACLCWCMCACVDRCVLVCMCVLDMVHTFVYALIRYMYGCWYVRVCLHVCLTAADGAGAVWQQCVLDAGWLHLSVEESKRSRCLGLLFIFGWYSTTNVLGNSAQWFAHSSLWLHLRRAHSQSLPSTLWFFCNGYF